MNTGTRDDLLSGPGRGGRSVRWPTRPGRHRRATRGREDHAGRRARRRPASPGPPRDPCVDRGLPSPPATALSPWRILPEGCYYDSFDFDSLHRVLLAPLGPDGDRRFRQAVYDHPTETTLPQPLTTAPDGAVLLFDGVFLLRPELIDRWDLRIFVSADFEVALDRARTRDVALFGSGTNVERRHRQRYGPSQQFYFDTVRPTGHADIIVYNDEPRQPTWELRTR